jgi:hypothetical protein
MTDLSQLTETGKRMEVRALIRNARLSLITAYDQLDPNTPEADALAKIITEMRLELEGLEKSDPVSRALRD